MPKIEFWSIISSMVAPNGVSAAVFIYLISLPILAQQPDNKTPVVVQPGAPGQPTRILPLSTRAKLPPITRKDVEFMQGMIMHHAQAVEMTALIETRTDNKDVRLLGGRISQSQEDEMKFMKRWLEIRGEPVSMAHTPGSQDHGSHGAGHKILMPGMLSESQMDALRNAKGPEFDRLFLQGMIQHHNGALAMVEELFESPGAGQDAELFNFASDVDSGQRAEIASMETLLAKKP